MTRILRAPDAVKTVAAAATGTTAYAEVAHGLTVPDGELVYYQMTAVAAVNAVDAAAAPASTVAADADTEIVAAGQQTDITELENKLYVRSQSANATEVGVRFWLGWPEADVVVKRVIVHTDDDNARSDHSTVTETITRTPA